MASSEKKISKTKSFGRERTHTTTQSCLAESRTQSSITRKQTMPFGILSTRLTAKNITTATLQRTRKVAITELFRLMRLGTALEVRACFTNGKESYLPPHALGRCAKRRWKKTIQKDLSVTHGQARRLCCNTLMKCRAFRCRTFGQIFRRSIHKQPNVSVIRRRNHKRCWKEL